MEQSADCRYGAVLEVKEEGRCKFRLEITEADSIQSAFTNSQCLCGVATPLAILISTFFYFPLRRRWTQRRT